MVDSEWYRGDRKDDWVIGLQPATNPPFSMSGLVASDFTMILIDLNSPDTEIVGDGTFSALTQGTSVANPSTITYAPGVNDVAIRRKQKRRVVKKRGTSQQQSFEIDVQYII